MKTHDYRDHIKRFKADIPTVEQRMDALNLALRTAATTVRGLEHPDPEDPVREHVAAQLEDLALGLSQFLASLPDAVQHLQRMTDDERIDFDILLQAQTAAQPEAVSHE